MITHNYNNSHPHRHPKRQRWQTCRASILVIPHRCLPGAISNQHILAHLRCWIYMLIDTMTQHHGMGVTEQWVYHVINSKTTTTTITQSNPPTPPLGRTIGSRTGYSVGTWLWFQGPVRRMRQSVMGSNHAPECRNAEPSVSLLGATTWYNKIKLTWDTWGSIRGWSIRRIFKSLGHQLAR